MILIQCENKDCGIEFESNKSTRKFCSKSCAARVNNSLYPKRISSEPLQKECPLCGVAISRYSITCKGCTKEYHRDLRIQMWLSGEWSGGSELSLSRTVREYLLKESNYACSSCGFDTPHPDDGSSILEIDHIDGNGSNHSYSNLRVLCPNCHALTSTYRGRNAGNGRNVSYSRKIKINDKGES